MRRRRNSDSGKAGPRMKNKFTQNIGLKIISVIAAFILWLAVVNVDDPVINRTYTGIPVEFLNADVIEKENKTFKVLDNTDTINVVVTAKRSVLDDMSKDYIKATADFNELTFLDTVPIEVRSIRYSDKIDSVTTRTESLKLEIENVIDKAVPVIVEYEGIVENGHVVAGLNQSISVITVTGPESVVSTVENAVVEIDITGADKDATITQEVQLCDAKGNVISDDRLTQSDNSVDVFLTVNDTKEIPISSGFSGDAQNGYAATGMVITNPSSVVVSGRGENYEDMDVIYITPDSISIDEATMDVTSTVDISDYLPTGVIFADPDFTAMVDVTVEVRPTQSKVISVPLTNITIDNIPTGYIANIVDIGGGVDVEIQGLGDTFDRYSGDLAIGRIDAMSLTPRGIVADDNVPIITGENDGIVQFDMPPGIRVSSPVSLMVIVDYVGDIPAAVGQTEGEDISSVSESSHETSEDSEATGTDTSSDVKAVTTTEE